MARPESRFIGKLTKMQIQRLEQFRDDGDTSRIRHRAHAVLLSARGTSVNELLRIFDSSRQTICSWLGRWEAEGFEGLGDKQRPGAPTKLNDLVWKRMRKSLRSKRDQNNLQHKRDLKKLQQEVFLGEHDLYYFDEAGFSLTPSVPYGWQPVGERYELPSSKSQQLNVLGFLDYRGKEFDPYVFEGCIDAPIAIECVNRFSAKLHRPTTLVIDNAPIHTSARLQSMIPEWEKQDLYLWFLPPYCPELNLIEILWKKIKYYWLPIDAYDSFEKLDECLCQVLANIGKKYRISFQ